MCYQGGQGKSGRQQMQEVARYPNQMVQSINQQYCGPVYPSLVLPSNRIHLKLGGCSSKPGRLLNLLALPRDFPLALSFAHCLSLAAAGHTATPSHAHQVTSALSLCLKNLSKFLNRIDCLIPLKEVVLHQLSDIIWTLCARPMPPLPPAEGEGERVGHPTLYALPGKFVQSVQQELLKLYECETSKFSKSKSSSGESKLSFPPVDSIGAGGTGRFSTYFQALLELVLAVLHYQHQFHGGPTPLCAASSSSTPTLVSASCPSVSASSGSSVELLTDTSSSTIRETTPLAVSDSAPTAPPINTTAAVNSSRSEVSQSATPTACAAPGVATPTDPSAGKKLAKRTRSRKGLVKKEGAESAPKKEEWLNIVRQSASLLRAVASDGGGASFSSTPSLTSLQPLGKSVAGPAHPSGRLVVLLGLPEGLSLEAVEQGIRRVCKLYGGLYKEELYLPSQEDSPQQHCGHAVLELCCHAHTSAVCSALLATPSLQQEGTRLQALAVNTALSCGQQEAEAQELLMSFLCGRLATAGGGAACSSLTHIFNSSCSEDMSGVGMSQVSASLLKFFSTFAELCAISLDNFMGGVWEEFADEEGLLHLEGFLKCYERDFLLNKEFSTRGVWLGLIECGYDLHLERCVHYYPEAF